MHSAAESEAEVTYQVFILEPFSSESYITVVYITRVQLQTKRNTSSANLSIGVMMKGIVERPMAVVVHLRAGRGHLVVLPSR